MLLFFIGVDFVLNIVQRERERRFELRIKEIESLFLYDFNMVDICQGLCSFLREFRKRCIVVGGSRWKVFMVEVILEQSLWRVMQFFGKKEGIEQVGGRRQYILRQNVENEYGLFNEGQYGLCVF